MRSVYEPDDAADDDATAETGMSRGKQWFVVATLVVSGILAPAYLYFVGPGSFGLGFRDTYLVIPMIPALLMGAVGVWTALRG
jgi:hypothetical protein